MLNIDNITPLMILFFIIAYLAGCILYPLYVFFMDKARR